nr:type II toxin-antitoxin system VapC family toxin [Fodinibius salsisoli]
MVIDASVAIKWFIWEEGTDEALQLLEKLTSFYAPDIFLMEIDAILTKKVRMKELDIPDAFEKRKVFRQMPYRLIPYKQIAKFAFRLATEFPITLYDAAYLSIAIDYETTFYTADKRLANGMSNTPFDEYIERLGY